MPQSQNKNVQIIKANYALQGKVGAGPLDKNTVERCQEVMDNNKVDFAPIGNELLGKLKATIDKLAAKEMELPEGIASMRSTVMQLKANAGTFGYDLIGNLANIMLSFLEALKKLDQDAIDIVSAHHQTLSIIVTKGMSGNGGEHGKLFEKELKDACKRYFDSHRKKKPA